jgi:predicted HicB family RNase H-like nuclease
MVDEHIEDCCKKNIPLEKSYKENLNIRLSPDLHKKASYKAALRGVSINQYINDAIEEKLTSADPP